MDSVSQLSQSLATNDKCDIYQSDDPLIVEVSGWKSNQECSEQCLDGLWKLVRKKTSSTTLQLSAYRQYVNIKK